MHLRPVLAKALRMMYQDRLADLECFGAKRPR